ncbi:SDR family NAD(P)-dependent oxidoreductase [Nocardia sp. 348MFTsu5.1]|jgi:3-oxoacyl-[acyl-carrier protein] reductase|uniref:SDR family NAD(P)-dependent oxidoreductase n=1 Tax=Nocardia sp. 348MFTsu5.1 TaxID=1172185 RepID=UPI0003A79AB6|nr:SDR family oxidoreductase [Nocardia sp. 348MFTsu5.1]
MQILITGGATGIGRAIAKEFRNVSGAQIVITGRTESALKDTAADLGIDYLVCDHSSPEDLSVAAQQLPAELDVIVNNAGGIAGFDEARAGLAGVKDVWLENYVANVLTAVLTVSELGRRINNGGRIINIGSIAAESGAGSYGSAKAAVSSWTVGLAKEFGHRGITANTISPGYIADTDFFKGGLTPERERDLVSKTQNGRRGAPEDIAALAGFLASPGAAHITGQTLHVNGGTYTTR